MTTVGSHENNGLLGFNGAILVGLFIFISLNPLSLSDILSLKDIDELIAKHQYTLNQIQITKQMDVQNKQTVSETLNTKNLSDTQKAIIMNTIKVLSCCYQA